MIDFDNPKILYKIEPDPIVSFIEPYHYIATIIDCETTGLDFSKDEPVEIAMLQFAYDLNLNIIGTVKTYAGLRQPNVPFTEEALRKTGITSDLIEGQDFDYNKIDEIMSSTNLFIAHNASFDRRMLQRFIPFFENTNWACSMNEIDWNSKGVEGKRLSHIAHHYGLWFEGHRAINDCDALYQVLVSSNSFEELITNARKKTYLIEAWEAPFTKKDVLKSNGYNWNPDQKVWFKETTFENRDPEFEWLQSEIYLGDIKATFEERSARTRFR